MQDVHCSNGPVSSLPGSIHSLPAGSMCDIHPQCPAVSRVQGETDSFGCEYVLMCVDCVHNFRLYREQERDVEKHCDWCGKMKKRVIKYRDMDEGTSGRVYDVCGDCRAEEARRAAEELADRGVDDFFDDDSLDDLADDQDEPEPPPCSQRVYMMRFRRGRGHVSDSFVLDRNGEPARWIGLTAAQKFLDKHKGKVRGRRIVLHGLY